MRTDANNAPKRPNKPVKKPGKGRPASSGGAAVKKRKSRVYNILIAVFAAIFLVAAGILGWQLYSYFSAGQFLQEISELRDQTPTQEELDQMPEGADVDRFAALHAKYPDFLGWITIDGTKIDYPVVQAEDNDYYLRRNMDGEYHRLGTVFADYRCDFGKDVLSDNTVVYGHSAFDGSYFRDLLKYKDLDYYKEHPVIHFDTIYGEQDWVIVGMFMAGIYPSQGELFEYHNFINAGTETAFDNYINEVYRRSYIQSDIPVEYGDKLLTLSTCDYEFDDSRFVVVARLLREGESGEELAQSAQANPNRFMPDAWYEAKGMENPN